MTVFISRTTRSHPALPYNDIKQAILGKQYGLSVVFIGADKARQLNQRYRSKQTIPDVLSFPLTDAAGEIYLCLPRIQKTCRQFGHTFEEHVGFLFIHGLLHLKGYDHGATMERAEKRYGDRFIYAATKNSK